MFFFFFFFFFQAEDGIRDADVTGVQTCALPIFSWLASKYVRLIMRIDIHDTTAGFICYKRKVLEKINLDRIRFVGYAFQIEMKFKAHFSNFKIKEVPVVFTDRTHGLSKMSSGIISEAVFGVFFMKFKSVFRKRKFQRKYFN